MADNEIENNFILSFFQNNEQNVEQNPLINDDTDDDIPNKFSILFVLATCLSFVAMDLFSLYYSYNDLINSSKNTSEFIFDKCIKYSEVTDIIFTIFATLAGLSAVFLSLGFLFYEIFTEVLLNSYLYYNYYLFGPLLFGASLFGLVNFNKTCYNCVENNPNNISLNVSMVVSLTVLMGFGGLVTCGFSVGNMFEFFANSIKFNKDGNSVVGKVFWKLAMYRNRNGHENSE